MIAATYERGHEKAQKTQTANPICALCAFWWQHRALSRYCRNCFSMQSAATRCDFFALRRKQVVVHRNHHRNEHYRVVEKMYLHSKLRKRQLQKAGRDWRAKPIVMS